MKKISRKALIAVLSCVVALGVCAAFAGCGSNEPAKQGNDAPAYKLVEDGKLTVGCSPDFPPFEYMDGDQIVGFDKAMMERIADKLGLELNYLGPQNFDTLVAQVAGGNTMDVAVSGISITDERLETVDFTEAYYDSNLAIVTLADSKIKSKDDLKTAKIAGQQGTSGEDWIKENLKKAEYIPFTQVPDALAALRAGKVEAVVYDLPVAQSHIAGEFNDCTILESIATGEQYGIAVNKDNAALTEAINAVLVEMKASGELDDLYTAEKEKADKAEA